MPKPLNAKDAITYGVKPNPNAKSQTLEISDPTGEGAITVRVQEFSTRNAFKAIGAVRDILKVLKDHSPAHVDRMVNKDGTFNALSFIEWGDVIANVIMHAEKSLPELIYYSLVHDAGAGHAGLSHDQILDLMPGDLVTIVRTIYTVNFVEGGLGKSLGALMPKTESSESSEESTTQSE